MKRHTKTHKKFYFVKSETHPGCYEMVSVRPKDKPKSAIRKIMFNAWWYSYIESIDKKYNTEIENI